MRGPDFVSTYRHQTTAFLNALEELMALKGQYVALDLGNTLTEDDFTGPNEDVDKADLVAAVGSMDALYGLFTQGHNTNLYQLNLL